MTTDKIAVIILGAVLIAFVYWFFLMRKNKNMDDVDMEGMNH